MLSADLIRLLALLLGAWLLGALAGQPLAGLFVAALLCVLWQQRNLRRLLRWLRRGSDASAPPEQFGVFEGICIEIDRLRERNKKRKKKLSRYLHQFRQAARALPDATVVLDGKARVKWANLAAERILGVRWPNDLDERVTNLVRKPEFRVFLERLDGDATLDMVSPVDATIYLNIRLAAYGDDEWLLVARDVTELQIAHQSRSDFVANVSHELRTPVTVFRGYLEALEAQQDRAPPEWRPVLEQLNLHASRMQSIIEELLLLSRLEQRGTATAPETVMVPELLSDLQREATRLSGEHAHLFSLEIDPNLYLSGNPRELYSAFSNIVFNAVTYTPPRGVIRLRWYRDETGAHMEVRDEGVGIPAQHLARITERFYRVDSGRARTRGGTGLGLAIVKHVLQRHDATLHIESEEGRGSLFRCDFPPQRIVAATANAGAATG
ncbi:MAG: phosphate regulon sensor histidine kinase PhoR [Gammaproteobacteria bacterium]|nr:phosphate regulon sensor histidine kinase PhoR [Gammaproteobacteria bacterium]